MDTTELRLMREQITSDFQMTWKLMGETADVVERQGKETAERLRQVEGRLRLTEQRFDVMLQAVEGELSKAAPMDRVETLEARVEALEQRLPAA